MPIRKIAEPRPRRCGEGVETTGWDQDPVKPAGTPDVPQRVGEDIVQRESCAAKVIIGVKKMASGKLILTTDGKIVLNSDVSGCPELAGSVAFDRDSKCCVFSGRDGLFLHAPFTGYPLAVYHPFDFTHQCVRLLQYCGQTLDNTLGGCQGYVADLSKPTKVFRYSECRVEPTAYSCSSEPGCIPWGHLKPKTCDPTHLNCLKIGPGLGPCVNADWHVVLAPDRLPGYPPYQGLPKRPPYYWPSCCDPVDFRPGDCTCMQEVSHGDLLWLPSPDDLRESLNHLPCLPRCGPAPDEDGCLPEQFMLYLWLEYVTAHVVARSSSDGVGVSLGLYAVNLLGGGIVRGWACAKPFDCGTGNSVRCTPQETRDLGA